MNLARPVLFRVGATVVLSSIKYIDKLVLVSLFKMINTRTCPFLRHVFNGGSLVWWKMCKWVKSVIDLTAYALDLDLIRPWTFPF